MTWLCRNHGLECKSYMESDLRLLNSEKVKPSEIKKRYPGLNNMDIDSLTPMARTVLLTSEVK